jgi:hypothetical protein
MAHDTQGSDAAKETAMKQSRPRKMAAIALLVVVGLVCAPIEGKGSSRLPMLVPGDPGPGQMMDGPEIPPHPAPSMSWRTLLSAALLGKGVCVVPPNPGKMVPGDQPVRLKTRALRERPTP